MKKFKFDELSDADLIVDAVYEGGNSGNAGDDPISKLLPGSGNQGGFRIAGSGDMKKYVVLYTSGEDRDWPDRIDLSTGQFIYYGDNKKPGHKLHDTQKGGNALLHKVFNDLHADNGKRDSIPPFFVFAKLPTSDSSRSVQFKGLAVPGFPGLSGTEDLVAIWKTTNGQRFQNYRSAFTILDVPIVSREWICDLLAGNVFSYNIPINWNNWVKRGDYKPLRSEPTTIIRSKDEQLPQSKSAKDILRTVYEHFKDDPIRFESFAARLFQMHDSCVIVDEITRGVVDGGRDAIGRYLLGVKDDPIYAEFALEAKCYRPDLYDASPTSVGVKEVSRLISRIRNRQFGVMVTTSFIGRQAYEEVREDKHPIIFICGRDISDILISNGYTTKKLVMNLLSTEFAY